MLNKKPKIIYITGGSASGKTTLSNQIIKSFGDDATLISLDSFYKTTHSKDTNYDVPSAIDFKEAISALEKLSNGEDAQIPIYDFEKHERSGTEIKKANEIIIVEGLFTLYDYDFSKFADFKIFVTTPSDTRLSRRIKRDINERGRELDDVIERWIRDVQPSYQEYIKPTKKYVDIVIPWHKIQMKAINALLVIIKYLDK